MPFTCKRKNFLWTRNCYMAGNFFPTACGLIGYFEVIWHLIMKLFPAKMSERATLQNLWRQEATVHDHSRMLSWPTTAVTARFNEFSASKFRLRQHWDSRETKLTVSLGTNQYLRMKENPPTELLFSFSQPSLRYRCTSSQGLVCM